MPRTIYSRGYRPGEALYEWNPWPSIATLRNPYAIRFGDEDEDQYPTKSPGPGSR